MRKLVFNTVLLVLAITAANAKLSNKDKDVLNTLVAQMINLDQEDQNIADTLQDQSFIEALLQDTEDNQAIMDQWPLNQAEDQEEALAQDDDGKEDVVVPKVLVERMVKATKSLELAIDSLCNGILDKYVVCPKGRNWPICKKIAELRSFCKDEGPKSG